MQLPQIAALIGPNNAGKSNVLLAIQRVLGREWTSVSSFKDEDVYGLDPSLDIKIAISFDPPIQYRKFKGSDPVPIATVNYEYTRYKIGEQKGARRLDQSVLGPDGKTPNVLAKAPKKGEQHSYQPLLGIPGEIRDAIPIIYVGTDRSLKEHLPAARNGLLRPLLEDIDRDLRDPMQTIDVQTPNGSTISIQRAQRFREIIEEAMKLLRTNSFTELEIAIKNNALHLLGFDPLIHHDRLDFSFGPLDSMDFYKMLDLKVQDGKFSVLATELGEGMQNALVIGILKAYEERRKKGAILLIEEPEMFMHPQMQRSINGTLREIGKTNQIIYTTHSPHFISIPNYSEILLIRKGEQGTWAKQSTLPIDPKRQEKLIKELDPERNEMFFANRVMLVEGDTEKLALPEYAKRLKIDLDREGATIIEVGGKRNLEEFAAIASDFCIPVGILYDQDSSDFQDKREEEKEYNRKLDALAKADGTVVVWRLVKDYEDILKQTIGEKEYQKACESLSNFRKPAQARLLAAQTRLPIPKVIEGALRWLSNTIENPEVKKS